MQSAKAAALCGRALRAARPRARPGRSAAAAALSATASTGKARGFAPLPTPFDPVGRPTRRGATPVCSAAPAATAAASQQPAPAPAAPPAGNDAPHVSVLLAEVLSFFEGRRLGVYVDGTLGAGGHAAAVLRAHPEAHTLLGFDLDPAAHALAGERLRSVGAAVREWTPADGPLDLAAAASVAAAAAGAGAAAVKPQAALVRGSFGGMAAALEAAGLVGRVDAMLLDLGMSSMQVDSPDRGFSFLRDAPLDMRMAGGGATAADAINCWPEAELGRVFRELGEERHWRGIARR